MQINPKCPVCHARRWEVIGQRRYLLADLPYLSEYVLKRYRVLFERWAVGEDAFECRSAMCSSCGFVSNIPRPDEKDVEEKYKFLAELGQDYGQCEALITQRHRASALYSVLRPWLPQTGCILDFGGGDGRLMRTFADLGYNCMLVDYNDSPQPFVRKLGDTIGQVSIDLKFHVIVCSHVIEHVAAPVDVLRSLRDHLVHRGIMFIEVPMEIWRKPPLHIEPVTHVNFFVPTSLQRCAMEAGLTPIYCRLLSSLHPNGTKPPAIRLVAENIRSPTHWSGEGTSEVARFLNPSWVDRLKHTRIMRRSIWAMVRKKASRARAR